MGGIRGLIKELSGLSASDTIRSFESFMAEAVRVMDALRQGVRLNTIGVKRFHPAMRAGLARAIPDIERAMCEALENQDALPLEVTAQAILIYRDPDTRDLLTPTLAELIEQVLGLEREGRLAVGA
jgi:hypothetical protein